MDYRFFGHWMLIGTWVELLGTVWRLIDITYACHIIFSIFTLYDIEFFLAFNGVKDTLFHGPVCSLFDKFKCRLNMLMEMRRI